MKNKIFSLCVIIFILLLCATVSADNGVDSNTTVENITNITTTTTSTSDMGIIENQIISETADVVSSNKVSKNNNQISINSNNSTSLIETVQSITENEDNSKVIEINSSDILKKSTIVNSLKLTADNVYSISGVVSCVYNETSQTYVGGEEDGLPVEGADVTLYNSKGDLVASTISSDLGLYDFADLNPDTYTVNFAYRTYANGSEIVTIRDSSRELDYVFIPDIAILTSVNTDGSDRINNILALRSISDRVYYIETVKTGDNYDDSKTWMLSYANFILVDMYSPTSFAIDANYIASTPASQRDMIAYTFGIYADAVTQSVNWGFIGDSPHSIENTYIGSYWQAKNADNETLKINMKNFFNYILYLLDESDYNPLLHGETPLLPNATWGFYYPGLKSLVKTPEASIINMWIQNDPGYNGDGSGSLNWMTNELAAYNEEFNNPNRIFKEFEEWYDKNVNISGSFVPIISYYQGGELIDAMIKEFESKGRATFNFYQEGTTPSLTDLLKNLTCGESALKRGISAISSLISWSTDYANMGTNKTIESYKDINVTLIRAVDKIDQTEYESEFGPQVSWTREVTIPGLEGVLGGVPVSYINSDGIEIIIESGVEKAVQLTEAYALLKDLNNSDKKISILVYSYPPGKADIGASYLDVFESVRDLLEHMYDAGYDIGMTKEEIPSTDELFTIISELSNKGTWASGLMFSYVKDYYVDLISNNQLISEEQYTQWFNELPASLQEQITKSWNTGLGNGSMIFTDIDDSTVVIGKQYMQWFYKLIGQNDITTLTNLINNNSIILNKEFSIWLNKTIEWFNQQPIEPERLFENSTNITDSQYRTWYEQVINWYNQRPESPEELSNWQSLNQTCKEVALTWYSKLSNPLDELIMKWELYQNSSMKYNASSIIIPGIFYGNVFISIQPSRGWEEVTNYHDTSLAPSPQYVSFYRYMSRIWGTNAVVHMGTHGTLEWLPGDTLGMKDDDWTYQLIETPIIYPYIVSNPGEGMTAKDRSLAQVITHMTPVTVASKLYGDYVQLNDYISRYYNAVNNNITALKESYKEYLFNLTESLGLEVFDEETLTQIAFDEWLDEIKNDIKLIDSYYDITLLNDSNYMNLKNMLLNYVNTDNQMAKELYKQQILNLTYLLGFSSFNENITLNELSNFDDNYKSLKEIISNYKSTTNSTLKSEYEKSMLDKFNSLSLILNKERASKVFLKYNNEYIDLKETIDGYSKSLDTTEENTTSNNNTNPNELDLEAILNPISTENNTISTEDYKNKIIQLTQSLNMTAYNPDAAFDEWLERISSQLDSMDNDDIVIGLHSLGYVWNETNMVNGVTTIASSRTNILQSLLHLYPGYEKADYYTEIMTRSFDDTKEEILSTVKTIINKIYEGYSLESIALDYGVKNDSELYQDLISISNIISGLLNNEEWYAIMNALGGGYVRPGLASDPSYGDVLPTGRSMYSSDTSKMPSQTAWTTAKEAVDEILRDYYEKNNGLFPELNAIVIWGTEVLRTEGISLGEFLYFLGVEPVWDNTGTYSGLQLIPLKQLTLTLSDGSVINRPRLDVFTTMVSSNPQWIKMLNDAVQLAFVQNETFKENTLRAHYYNGTESLDRIFGLKGAVLEGTGVSDLAPNVVNWQNSTAGVSKELTSVYTARVSYAWSISGEGTLNVSQSQETFLYLLSHVSLLTQNLDSSWRVTDSDDYADWFGGLLCAANDLGAVVNTALLDIRDQHDIGLSTLSQQIEKELRTTLLNPTYYKSLENSASGWNSMAAKLQNAMEFMFTTQNYAEDKHGNAVKSNETSNNAGALSNGLIVQVAKLLVSDDFRIDKDYKAYSFESMAGWLLTTDMNGFWKSNSELREKLANKYVSVAAQYGIACCHHTCKNVVFNKWVVSVATVPPGIKQQYSDVMKTSTSFHEDIYQYADGQSGDGSGGTGTGFESLDGAAEGADSGVNHDDGNVNGADSGTVSSVELVQGADGTIKVNVNAESLAGKGQGTGSDDGQESEGQSEGDSDVTDITNSTSNADLKDEVNANTKTNKESQSIKEAIEQSSKSSENYASSTSNTQGISGSSEGNSGSSGTGESSNSTSSSTGNDATTSSDSSSSGSASSTSTSTSSSSGSSSGSSGSSSALVYKIVKKQDPNPVVQQAEIEFGYLVAIILIALLFFIGFRRKGARKYEQ